MDNSSERLRRYLSTPKYWTRVAMVLAVVLLGYTVVQAMQVRSNGADVEALNSEILQVTRVLRRTAVDTEASEAKLALQEQALEKVRQGFGEAGSDDLVAVLGATAAETGVALQRVSAGSGRVQTIGEVQYRTQGISLTLTGDRADLFRFLNVLYEKEPVIQVASITISGPASASSAQLQLLFYREPEPAREE